MTKVSNHLIERIMERTHLPRKQAISFWYRAIRDGIYQGDIRNKKLREYVDSTVHFGYYGIVYCRYLLIVGEDSNTGVTILILPTKFFPIVDNVDKFKNKGVKKKNEQRNSDSDESLAGQQWQKPNRLRRQRIPV